MGLYAVGGRLGLSWKDRPPGWGAGETPRPEVWAANAYRCEYLL